MMYDDVTDIDFSLDDIADRDAENAVLMVEPTHYDVVYELEDNVFMDETYAVDRGTAWAQWQAVMDAYQDVGVNIYVSDGEEGLPDMVFSANHAIPYGGQDRKQVVLSNMKHGEREEEVEHVREWFEEQGYAVHTVPDEYDFEGTGDAVWHPGKELVWGGYGVRSDKAVYETIRDVFEVPVITLELDPEKEWYHLDTCFAPLSEDVAMAYRGAFTEEDWEKIDRMFETVVEVPEDEAKDGLAANAHSPDGQHVIMNAGNPDTMNALEAEGFTVKPVDTGEFGESGGSVYCMKLAVPE